MYKSYYKLWKSPFSLTPDPDFLYLSAKHKNALAVLERSLVNWVGLSTIIGEKGTGKSTLIQYLLKQPWPDLTFGVISESDNSRGGLLKRTLSAFGLNSFGKTASESYELFSDFLVLDCFWKRRQPVLIIDEALGTESRALDELYMISTMEPEENQNLRIILAMSTSLWETLKRPTWTHLARRVGNSYHLKTLDHQETVAYVLSRLKVAGAQNENLFADTAYGAIFRYSGGNPRLINVLCNAALVEGAIQEKPQISATFIKDLIRQKLWLRAAVPAPQGEAQERSESEGKKVDQAAGVKSDTDDLRPARRDRKGQTVSEFIIADIDYASRKYARLDAEVSKVSDQHESEDEAPQGTSKRFLRVAVVAAILFVTAAIALLFVRDRSSRGPQLTQSDQETQGKGVITSDRSLVEARQKLDLPDPLQAVSESASGVRKFLAQQDSRNAPKLQTGDEAVPEDATVDTEPSIPDETAPKPNKIDRGSEKRSVPQKSDKDNTTGLIAKEEMRAIAAEPTEASVAINSGAEQTFPGGTESIEQQVTGLLARAEQQIAAQHLTTPAGDTALETYQSILELVPGHRGALHGITRIKQLYLTWAAAARQRGEFEKAQSYAERAATVDPQDSDVVPLLDQIKAERKLKAQRAAEHVEELPELVRDKAATP